jgi:hypothetical protein
METKAADLLLLQHVLADGVLRAGLLGDVHDGRADGHAGGLRGAEVVEVVRHLVEFLRADDEVDVGQAVEQLGAAVLRHAAEDAEDEVRLLLLAGGEVAALPMAFCSAASRTLQVLSSMMSQLSSSGTMR